MSNKRCKICQLAGDVRAEIEKLIIEGKSGRGIATQYSHLKISHLNIKNHVPHIAHELTKNQNAKIKLHTTTLMASMQNLYDRADTILSKCEDTNQHSLSLQAIRELRSFQEFLLKFSVHMREAEDQKAEKALKAGFDRELVEKLKNNLSTSELTLIEKLFDKASGNNNVTIYLPENNRTVDKKELTRLREKVKPKRNVTEGGEIEESEGLEGKTESEIIQEIEEETHEIEASKPVSMKRASMDEMFPGSGPDTVFTVYN